MTGADSYHTVSVCDVVNPPPLLLTREKAWSGGVEPVSELLCGRVQVAKEKREVVEPKKEIVDRD
eukprot:scaffold315159_cov32-Prasinocladus_malaysianus.AAC.1